MFGGLVPWSLGLTRFLGAGLLLFSLLVEKRNSDTRMSRQEAVGFGLGFQLGFRVSLGGV